MDARWTNPCGGQVQLYVPSSFHIVVESMDKDQCRVSDQEYPKPACHFGSSRVRTRKQIRPCCDHLDHLTLSTVLEIFASSLPQRLWHGRNISLECQKERSSSEDLKYSPNRRALSFLHRLPTQKHAPFSHVTRKPCSQQ